MLFPDQCNGTWALPGPTHWVSSTEQLWARACTWMRNCKMIDLSCQWPVEEILKIIMFLTSLSITDLVVKLKVLSCHCVPRCWWWHSCCFSVIWCPMVSTGVHWCTLITFYSHVLVSNSRVAAWSLSWLWYHVSQTYLYQPWCPAITMTLVT